MSARALLLRRLPYAILLAVALVGGTLAGGAIYESLNPPFERIVWLERASADDAGDVAIRRALFEDGRFLALYDDGYRAGVLDAGLTAEIFTTARSADWQATYPVDGIVGELVEIAFDGPTDTSVVIANPDMNVGLPDDLGRLLRLIESADRAISTLPFVPSSVRFIAAPMTGDTGEPIDPIPVGFPLESAARPDGVVVSGADLAVVGSIWTDLATRFEPGLAHRIVEAGGQHWRVSWRLDLDAFEPLAATGAAR